MENKNPLLGFFPHIFYSGVSKGHRKEGRSLYIHCIYRDTLHIPFCFSTSPPCLINLGVTSYVLLKTYFYENLSYLTSKQ